MKVNLKEIFCELLSGLALILLIIPILYLLGEVTIDEILKAISQSSGAVVVTLVIGVSFILGIIMDAVGLALGSLFLDKLICENEPQASDYQKYWKEVTPELSAYREGQWAYYSCYRNLFIIIPPLLFFWSRVIYLQGNSPVILVLVVFGVLIEVALLKSMIVLLDLFYRITCYDLSEQVQGEGDSSSGG